MTRPTDDQIREQLQRGQGEHWNNFQRNYAGELYPLDLRTLFANGLLAMPTNSLNGYRFDGRVIFDKLRVPNDFIFRTEFVDGASFNGTVFAGTVRFQDATFNGVTEFVSARFRGPLIVLGGHRHRHAGVSRRAGRQIGGISKMPIQLWLNIYLQSEHSSRLF